MERMTSISCVVTTIAVVARVSAPTKNAYSAEGGGPFRAQRGPEFRSNAGDLPGIPGMPPVSRSASDALLPLLGC
jgi:hypothetical protein